MSYTLYLVFRGVTTNEMMKWDEISEMIADGRLYRVARQGENWKEQVGFRERNDVDHQIQDDDDDINKSELRRRTHSDISNKEENANAVPEKVKVLHLDELDNIYDRGWWVNLMDVLFPPKL